MIEEVLCITRVGSMTVFAVESGPVQIATCIIRGKQYIKVSEYEYFWKLIDSRSKLVFIYIYPVLSRIRRSIYEVNQERLCVSKINYLPLNIFFIIVACPGHILESTKALKLNIDANERKTILPYILLELSFLNSFIQRGMKNAANGLVKPVRVGGRASDVVNDLR